MKIRLIKLELHWPKDLQAVDLRNFLLLKIKDYGEPLRWAITEIEPGGSAENLGKLKVEALLLINQENSD